MFNIIFTTDYEIHGNGEGLPESLMIEPTYRNLSLFDQYGAKLTIMADMGEIICYQKHKLEAGQDDFGYDKIIEQLQKAVQTGHDVQLHMHPHFFSAFYDKDRWNFSKSTYNLENATYEELASMVKLCKTNIEMELKKVKSDYKCNVFRAGGWEMHPSKNIVRALVDNGFIIDTSVFKNGKRNGMYKFDYSSAHHNLIPWSADENDVCKPSHEGNLLEIPIATSQKYIYSFISLNRFYRVAKQKKNIHPKNRNGKISYSSKIRSLFQKHPLKMDYNQCSGKQLINELRALYKKFGNFKYDLPVVLIGHSKSFTKYNEENLKPFLKYIQSNPEKFRFALFSDLNLDKLRTNGA
jgi:hypothetical protein